MRNTAAQCRRALKLQARQTFFLYRRPCLLCAFLLLCVSLAAQFFTAYSGGALFYAFLDVRQLPLDTGLWLAGPELMSSLMTTMAQNIAVTIRMIRQAGYTCKIMVGGAVVTQSFADQIGADFYAKDAAESARYAATVFGK